MAKVSGGLVAELNEKKAVAKKGQSAFTTLIETSGVRDRFVKMFQDPKKAAVFLSSALTLYNNDSYLQDCKPGTILSALSIAASLDLPINKSLGMAYIVPYKDQAQFQIGWKGVVQLAMRSGLMKSIIVTEVYEGELDGFNRFTEELNLGEKKSDTVVGYYASFETVNGFVKRAYWSKEKVIAHANRYSKAYQMKKKDSPWLNNFDAMAKKTVLKDLLDKFAPKTTQMEMALQADNGATAEVNDNGDINLIDVEAQWDDAAPETVETKEAPKTEKPVQEEVPPPVEPTFEVVEEG